MIRQANLRSPRFPMLKISSYWIVMKESDELSASGQYNNKGSTIHFKGHALPPRTQNNVDSEAINY